MRRYRIGIVGTGGIARAHIEGYRAVAGDIAEVVAGCDPDAASLDAFCTSYGVPHRFASSAELIESGLVDVISVLTPPAVRGEVILPAIERGVHVLVEKPFAENLADAVSFVAVAERASTLLAVNQSLRFMPDVLMARDIITEGEIGEVRCIVHNHYQNRTRTVGWRKDEVRLEISIFSIHVLDRIRWLCGSTPTAVNATTRNWSDEVRGETFTALTIQFASGAVGSMVSNWHAIGVPQCRLRIDGTAGSFLSEKRAITANSASVTIQRDGQEIEREQISLERAAVMNMGASMKHLLHALARGESPHHSGLDNLQTMAIVDAAYLSAGRHGARVDIEEVWAGTPE